MVAFLILKGKLMLFMIMFLQNELNVDIAILHFVSYVQFAQYRCKPQYTLDIDVLC